MSMAENCSADDVELVINFDGTLSLNSQMRDARGVALPLIQNLRQSVRNLKVDFSYFGDRTTRPHNFNRWILPELNQSCHMPILPLTDDLDYAVEKLDRILKRFVPVSGGLDDPAEDSLGSLYKILSNFQIRDFHRQSSERRGWSKVKKEKLRIILTVSDSKGHHAEDGTLTNQGPLDFPPIPDLSEEPLICDPKYAYVPLNLLAEKLRASSEDEIFSGPYTTHLITYTDQAFTGWWFWLYDKINATDRSDVVSGDVTELLSTINELICKFSNSLKNTTPWPMQPAPMIPGGVGVGGGGKGHHPSPLLFSTEASFMSSIPSMERPSIPWGGVSDAQASSSVPSAILRFLMVMIISAMFVCGCCATWCLKKTAYLKPDVVPTVSMAPADSVAASEYRDEMASVTSGQYA